MFTVRAGMPSFRSIARFVIAVVRVVPAWGLVAAIAALVGAQLVRDHAIWLAYLMYMPLWPVAALAVAWDLLWLGRGLPLRWLLLCLGLATGLLAVGAMWSPARPPEGDDSRPALVLAHWNMQWGGRQAQQSLDAMIDVLAARRPDILLVSESPHAEWLRTTWERRAGPDAAGWHLATVGNRGVMSYWWRLTVMSRFPVRLAQQWDLPHGAAALFEVNLPAEPNGPTTSPAARPLRLMIVDLESHPYLPRTPGLRAAARIVDDFARAGTPIDVVAGDFNTPARFRGFDDLARAGTGYDRAAMWSGQWRATWPSRFPVFDIDHVWVRRGIDVARAEIFRSQASDHSGQLVQIRLPHPRYPFSSIGLK